MRSGLFVPIFDEPADPAVVAHLSADAEEAGWHGVFVWDHIQFRGVREVADPWITLAAIATATSRIRLGPMVTPLAVSPSGLALAATDTRMSFRRRARNSTTGGAHPCSMSHSRS